MWTWLMWPHSTMHKLVVGDSPLRCGFSLDERAMDLSWYSSHRSWSCYPCSDRWRGEETFKTMRFCHLVRHHRAGKCCGNRLEGFGAWDRDCRGSLALPKGSSLCMPHIWCFLTLCQQGRRSNGHSAMRKPCERCSYLRAYQSCAILGSS